MNPARICQNLRDHRAFEPLIIGVIAVAAVVIGLETSPVLMAEHGKLLHLIDKIILWIFVAEAAIKITAEWPRPWRYFKSGWNVFDFTIVAVCFLPFGGPWIAIMRMARILRSVRLITQIPRLQVLVAALLRSLPSMGYVSLLLGLHFYVYAVMGVFFFRENDPGHFGDLGKALLSLFRVVTLEDWTDVMYSAIYGTVAYPAQGLIPTGPDPHAFGVWGVLYFVSFVVIGAMVMINLFVGVMVNSISDAQAEQIADKAGLGEQQDEILEHVKSIESELSRLRERLQDDKT